MTQTKVELIDLNGKELVLDADADTSITADTDDVVHVKTGGTDRLTVQSSAGLNVVIADGLQLTNGNIGLASGHGINFSATADSTGVESEVLNDYEDGTWTIVVEDHSSNAMTTDSSIRQGSYVKVGDVVHVTGYVSVTGLGSASGSVRVTGLPFNIANNNRNYPAMTIGYAAGLNITAGTTVLGVGIINTGDVNLTNWDATGGTTNLTAAKFSADGQFIFSMTYTVV